MSGSRYFVDGPFINRATTCRCQKLMRFSDELSEARNLPSFVCDDCKIFATFIGFNEETQTWAVERGPLPGGGVCDFCSEPDPKWEFPCVSFDHYAVVVDDEGVERSPDDHGSIGNWAACDECMGFIEANDLRGLSSRALLRQPSPFPEFMHEVVLEGLMELHKAFFDNRTGPVMPINWEIQR